MTILYAVIEKNLIAKLDHHFADPALLKRALTHASWSKDHYQRLEFLGDRVLGLVIAEWLSELEPKAKEGVLAKRLAALVGRESLAEVARRLDLGAAILLSSSDESIGSRDNSSILADCCEAVIAALYLDGGLEVARSFIKTNWSGLIDRPPDTGDSKTQLQEWTQARRLGVPVYTLVSQSGPDHAPNFTVEVAINGYRSQSAVGPTKRVAERLAAEAMLKQVNNDR